MRYSRRELKYDLGQARKSRDFYLEQESRQRARHKNELDRLTKVRIAEEQALIRLGLIPARFLYRSAEASRLVINWTAVNKAVKDLETYESSARGAVLKAELKEETEDGRD